MSNQTAIDLTHGSEDKTLIKLATPIIASMFLSTAYTLTDMAWVGTLGSEDVTAVGVSGMYTWLSSGLISLAKMGGQVMVGQTIGAGNRSAAGNYAKAALQISVFLGLTFGLTCNLFTGPMVDYFHLTKPETISMAQNYLRIACGLIIFFFLAFTLTGISTAEGDSQTPFRANFIGLVFNMICDPILILGLGPVPHLGIIGAAIATVSAQFIVTAIIISGMLRNKHCVLRETKLFRMPPIEYYMQIFRVGFPTAIQNMIYCGISFVIARLVSKYGEDAIGTQRVGNQIESLSWNIGDGFASAMNAFASQNYGAGKYDRVRRGYRFSLRFVILWGLLVTSAFVFAPDFISNIFFHEPHIIGLSNDYLRILGFGETFMCIELMTIGGLSGLGRTAFCSIVSIILTGIRIPLAWGLSSTSLGLNGIWWAYTISSTLKGIIFMISFGIIINKINSSKLLDD